MCRGAGALDWFAVAKRPTKRRIGGADEAADPADRKTRAPVKKVDLSAGKPSTSSRYTPPSTRVEDLPSPMWVPVLMFAMFGLGMAAIILNYVSLLPSAPSNWYLLLGLGFILGGIITATQYR